MTEERDAKVSAAYRALGAEEPPRALDEAILGAARQAAQPWTRRWAVPLSLAAVVVLSVTVTLRVQHEQPGIEQPAPAREEARVARQAPAQVKPATEPVKPATEPVKPAAEPATPGPQLKSTTRKEAEAFPRSMQDRGVAEDRAPAPAAAPAPAPATAPAARLQSEDALAKRADANTASVAGSAAGSVAAPAAPAAPAMREMPRERLAAERMEARQPALTPEQELERIAGLRKEQKHDEADKALAEFRKRYPDFRISEAIRERVERRQ